MDAAKTIPGPDAPGAPVAPAGPVCPAGPCGPVAPVGPCGPAAPVGPMIDQLIPVSPATQREVEATMRTAPVVEFTQAETFVDTGAAMATVPTRNEDTSTTSDLRADIETSREILGKLRSFMQDVHINILMLKFSSRRLGNAHACCALRSSANIAGGCRQGVCPPQKDCECAV
jgi:hypothetical protein